MACWASCWDVILCKAEVSSRLCRSVVVALRGTTSVEDIITDSVAEPEKLDAEWIPKCIRNQASGPLFAHAGIKAAADAVLKVYSNFVKRHESALAALPYHVAQQNLDS